MSALRDFRETHGLTGDRMPLVSKSAGRTALARLFASMRFRRGAEIGVWEGSYAKQLCETNPGVELFAVDPWQAHEAYREAKNDKTRLDAAYAKACQMLKPFNGRIMRMMSIDAAREIPDGSLDFVFVDGNHAKASVLADLDAWTPKVRSGGIMSGHDYRINDRKPWIEVPEAVNEFTQANQISPWYVLAADKSPSWFWVKA